MNTIDINDIIIGTDHPVNDHCVKKMTESLSFILEERAVKIENDLL